MKLGTGLDHYAEHYPDRLIDVGIAEEHAVTMAAGLAAGGMRPYVAVYASFFQRCYDQMVHDVCMQNLPVTFLLDRSGIGGEDGQTHHGLFDLSTALPVPGLTVLAPATSEELIQMLKWTAVQAGPCLIRYPKSVRPFRTETENGEFIPGKWIPLTEQCGTVLLATGSMTVRAMEVKEILHEYGIAATVVNCPSIKPLDESFLQSVPHDSAVFTMEEHMLTGGFGEYVCAFCNSHGYTVPIRCFGVKDQFIQHGDHERLMKEAGLDADTMAMEIRRILKGETIFDRKNEG